MAETAREVSQEYWRPAQPPQTQFAETHVEAFCAHCGTQLAPGARFCHICGAERVADTKPRRTVRRLEALRSSLVGAIEHTAAWLGVSIISLLLAGLATAFALAAIAVGFAYHAETYSEWQAVQTWRIEWMLASLVTFAAAMLFKHSAARKG